MSTLSAMNYSTRHPLNAEVRAIIQILEARLGIPRQKKARAVPVDMLIGTLLSQNTNDRNSHRAYTTLRKRFPTWKKVADAPVRAIAAAIRVGGMKNQKSARIKALLHGLKEQRGSYNLRGVEKLNDDEVIENLTRFHGIGVKTAACVLLFSLRRNIFPVDTHVHRICNRLGLVRTNSPDKTFETMRPLIPDKKAYSFHTNLIRFGRSVCHARNPRCGRCPLFTACSFRDKRKYAANTTDGLLRHDHKFMLLDEI